MTNLLVTGHSGFVGRTLVHAREEIATPHGIRLLCLPDGQDIRDPSLAAAVAALEPSAILHLAACTNVDDSFRDPDTCFDINYNGTLNLLRALRSAGFSGRFLYVSSGDCYGRLPESRLPVDEGMPLRPRNPYAVSKTATEALCYQWSQTEGFDVVIARPFNHIGPGQDARFAIASFCRQIALIARKSAEPVIRTGNLDVTRDFTDVQDVLRAYVALLAQGRTGEAYNVASGREVRVGDVLRDLISMAGIEASIEGEAGRVRTTEQWRVVADVSKIRKDTGWQAEIPLRTTLEATLNYWQRQAHDE